MRKLIKGRFAILASFLIIVLLLSLLVTVSMAWFYFPTTQNVTIYTDINHEINVELYRYNNVGAFVQSTPVQLNPGDEKETVISNSGEATTFVEWGGIFYPTLSFTNYYMLVLTYPESNFSNGYLNVELHMELFSGMHENPDNTLSPNDKILYTNIAYAVAPNANMDPLSVSAPSKAQAALYTSLFTPIIPPVVTTETPPDFMYEDHLSILLKDLDEEQYTNRTESGEECRIILFIRIESDASHIASSIAQHDIATDVVQIATNNIYKFSCNFRSEPFKTEPAGTQRLGFDRLNCVIYDKGLYDSYYIYDNEKLQQPLT